MDDVDYLCLRTGLDFTTTGSFSFDDAVAATEFGKFHYLLLLVCGFIYLDTAIEITLLSFVIPAAKCDLEMTVTDEAWLNAAPMLGMMFGSYFWGCIADTRGRKRVLIVSLLINGLSGIAASFSPYLIPLIFFRFICGFGIAGAMGICFPYLGEFQCTKYREKVLGWMELFWTAGIILLPVIAKFILPLKIIGSQNFFFHSWNLFILLCSIPAIVLSILLLWFPESPKFLMELGYYDQALEILSRIFVINTGHDSAAYPVESLSRREERLLIIDSDTIQTQRSVLLFRTRRDFKIFLKESYKQTMLLFKLPHLKPTVITCLIQFGLTSGYYTLMTWFPELFNRFDHHNGTATLCEVLQTKLPDVDCSNDIDNKVYKHEIIIGLACIPTSLWLPLCVHRLGLKFFLE